MTLQKDKPSAHYLIVLAVVVLGGLALALFVLLGLGGFFDSGDVSGKECFDYQTANGDWANSCDL